jgi:hypothetical protein
MSDRISDERIAEIVKTLRALWPEAQRDVDALLGEVDALKGEVRAGLAREHALREALEHIAEFKGYEPRATMQIALNALAETPS